MPRIKYGFLIKLFLLYFLIFFIFLLVQDDPSTNSLKDTILQDLPSNHKHGHGRFHRRSNNDYNNELDKMLPPENDEIGAIDLNLNPKIKSALQSIRRKGSAKSGHSVDYLQNFLDSVQEPVSPKTNLSINQNNKNSNQYGRPPIQVNDFGDQGYEVRLNKVVDNQDLQAKDFINQKIGKTLEIEKESKKIAEEKRQKWIEKQARDREALENSNDDDNQVQIEEPKVAKPNEKIGRRSPNFDPANLNPKVNIRSGWPNWLKNLKFESFNYLKNDNGPVLDETALADFYHSIVNDSATAQHGVSGVNLNYKYDPNTDPLPGTIGSTIWVNHSISEPIYLQKIRPTKAVRPGADRKRAQGITSVRVIGNFEPLDYQCSRKAISRFNWLQQQKSDGSTYSEGHCGEKVELKTQAEKDNHKQMLARFGWSITNSDKIPLDRLPPDLRMPECKEIDYPPNLPKAIVIFVFHNEAWTTLMRSVHTVIRQTPRQLITHILLVDDGSTRQHLGHLLEEYIEANWPDGFVILHRNQEREGLIRAKTIAAKIAMKLEGEVLVFLDAHCEPQPNWLPPLLAPIARDKRISTAPLIDSIHGEYFTFSPQAGGDKHNHARGAWNWRLDWKRLPLTEKWHGHYDYSSEPYPTSAMAGGLFAIHKDYFAAMNYYDDGLLIWGAENFEISWKIWMCHGKVVFVPCSRVGHIYRMPGWHGNPSQKKIRAHNLEKNYMRIVDVWLADSYKKYFYRTRPWIEKLDYGDISHLIKWKEDNKCKSFEWYMENVAGDVLDRYPLLSPVKRFGMLKLKDHNICIDSASDHTKPISTFHCNSGTRQMMIWTEDKQIVHYLNHHDENGYSIVPISPIGNQGNSVNFRFSGPPKIINPNNAISFVPYVDHIYKIWDYNVETSQIKFIRNGDGPRSHFTQATEDRDLCLDLMSGSPMSGDTLTLGVCEDGKESQRWEFQEVYW